MCICLAATLLTHVGTVPSNKSHNVSHCLFLDCSYLFGRAAVSLSPPSLAPSYCRATITLLCIRLGKGWWRGRVVSPLHQVVGATTAFSHFSQENHCWPCLVYFSSLSMCKTVGMYLRRVPPRSGKPCTFPLLFLGNT